MSLDEYERLKVIGKGSYGEVWLAKHKSDRKQYVLKKMDLRKASKKERLAAEQEAKLLSNLRHPNIVAYKDTFEGGDGYLYIAMGYCEKGDLYSKLKELKGVPLEERQVVEWFVQIAMALQYMHERNILHRDLKTQNIFLTKNKIIKVGDLGIARVLDSSSDMATTLIGTPYYMSPELFSNKPYNFKSDVWALGCCVYEMTTLKHAFNAKDMNALMYRVLRGKLPPMPDMYRKELVDLIKAMLNKSPDKRPSVNRILRDPYIKENIAIFLEGTKNSINRRPDSAKKERLMAGDGNRPRKPKSDPLSLEPLNTSPDGLEPIKEECTPRESIDTAGSSNRSKNSGKGSEEPPGNSGSSKANFDKNSQKDQGISSEKHPVAAEAEEANVKSVDAAAGQKLREKRRPNQSKLSKLPESGYMSGNLDSAKGSCNDREQHSQLERDIRCSDNAKCSSSSESLNAASVRTSRSDESIASKDVPSAKVRTSSKKKAWSLSSVNKPPLPESRSSSVSDSMSDVEVSVVKRSSVPDFRSAVAEPKSERSERRVSKSEPRSSSSELKPPIPLPRSSDPASSSSSPPKCESSPSISKSSASKSRYSNAQITEGGNAFLTDEKKSEARHRPLPPRPLSSSVNPEQSRAVTSRSSRSVSSGVDSGHSTSTSSSGYSGKEELGDAPDDRILERISRSSQDVPVPRQSIESNARQRRRQQLQQQTNTPRMSKSIDVSITPLESFRGSCASDADQRERKSTNYENYKSAEERKPSRESSFDRSSMEREKLPFVPPGRNENGNSSEPEEDDNSSRKTQEKEENKEISRFINLLGTTLLMKKTKDSDDEIDGKLEGSIEESCSSPPKSVYGRTYLMPAPSPLPPGSKYPYIDEGSRPLAKSKNSRQKTPQESPVMDRDSEMTDKLDSAISMTSTGRLFERIALLRRDCIHALGVQKLKIAYDILECFDTDELEPKLIDLLGQEAFDAYAGKIWQLKFCEDSAFRLQ